MKEDWIQGSDVTSRDVTGAQDNAPSRRTCKLITRAVSGAPPGCESGNDWISGWGETETLSQYNTLKKVCLYTWPLTRSHIDWHLGPGLSCLLAYLLVI